MLSYGTWARRFGSDRGILGKKIMLNGVPYEIVGVMPRSFSLPREVMPTLDGAEQAEILLPLPLPANAAQNRDHEDYNILGKLKPGVSVQQAQAEMDTITARLRHDFPEVYPPNGGLTFGIVPLLEQVVGNVRRTLYLLLGSGWLCPADRVRERSQSATVARRRTAKGNCGPHCAGCNPHAHRSPVADGERVACVWRWRIVGIVLAFLAVHWVRLLGPQSVPRVNDIGIGLAALAFTFVVSVFVGDSVWTGAGAAGCRGSTCKPPCRTPAAPRLASARFGDEETICAALLVIAEIALCAMLLIGAGLLIRSFVRVRDVNPGFNPRNVLTLELTMTGERYKTRRRFSPPIMSYGSGWKICPASPRQGPSHRCR